MLGCGGADGFPPLDLVGIYGGARAYVKVSVQVLVQVRDRRVTYIGCCKCNIVRWIDIPKYFVLHPNIQE